MAHPFYFQDTVQDEHGGSLTLQPHSLPGRVGSSEYDENDHDKDDLLCFRSKSPVNAELTRDFHKGVSFRMKSRLNLNNSQWLTAKYCGWTYIKLDIRDKENDRQDDSR